MSPSDEEENEEPPSVITEMKPNNKALSVAFFQLRQTHQSGLNPN